MFITRNFQIKTQSIDKSESKEKGLEVIFASEEPARRDYFFFDQPFDEILGVTEKEMNLDFLRSSKAPFLKNHYNDVDDVLGVVESVKVDKGKAYAKIKVSEDSKSLEVKSKIDNGILRNISVGYTVEDVEEVSDNVTRSSDEVPQIRVTQWTPREVSLVGVPLDTNSETLRFEKRSQLTDQRSFFSRKAFEKMKTYLNPKKEENLLMKEKAKVEKIEKKESLKGFKPAFEIDGSAARSLDQQTDLKEDFKAKTKLLLSLKSKFNLEDDFVNSLIESEKDQDQIRKEVLDKVSSDFEKKAKETQYPALSIVQDEIDSRKPVMSDYLGFLLSNGARKMNKDTQNSLIGFDMKYASRWFMGSQRIPDKNLFQRLLSTADFPELLASELNKELLRGYAPESRTYEPLVRNRIVNDLKSINLLKVDIDAIPEEVAQGAEYKSGSIVEAKDSYSIKKYGKLLLITEETFINDDLGAIGNASRSLGNHISVLENNIFWALITSNANVNGSALFSSSRNNTISSIAIGTEGLDSARRALKVQRGLSNRAYLNIQPRYIIVPEALFGRAQSLFASYVPDQFNNSVQFRIDSLRGVISDPRLDDNSATRWYLSGSADETDLFEKAYLAGNENPIFEQENLFKRDSVAYKLKIRFGFAIADFRSIVRVG